MAAALNKGRFISRRAVLLAAYSSLVFALLGCRQNAEAPRIVPNQELQSVLLAQYPIAVSVSPSGGHLLVKTRHLLDFELNVLETVSRTVVAIDRSPDTQLSLTWRPDGKAIVFQESQGGNREYSLFLFDLDTGKRRRLKAPVTSSAAPPLRWSPSGESLAYLKTSGSGVGNIVVLDMSKESAPPLILDPVTASGDFSWSPDSRQIAAVSASDNGAIVVMELERSGRKSLMMAAGGTIRHLAWAPNGKSLLVSARRRGDEFFGIFKVELENSRVTQFSTQSGDCSIPLWLPNGESFIYHLNQSGNLLPCMGFLDGSPSQMLGFTSGVNQVQTVAPDGTRSVVLAKSATRPPALYSVDLVNGVLDLLYAPPTITNSQALPPEMVEIKSKDGRIIPSLLWRAPLPSSKSNFVLIDVHGGPRLQVTPEWDSAKQFLAGKGIHILSIDYRGSTGHGASFEEAGNLAVQIEDVLAACDYADQVLKASKRGIVLLGSSYGSTLVLGASVRRSELLAGIVLVSVPATPREHSKPQRQVFHMTGFQGESDTVLTPPAARLSIEQYLGAQSFAHPDGHWEVLSDEGHHFHRTLSWAKVYTAILQSFSGNNSTLEIKEGNSQ